MLWAYILVFSALLLATMLSVDPELARERTHPQAGGQDGRSLFGAGFLFLVTVGFAAMDVGRWHQSDAVPMPVSIIVLHHAHCHPRKRDCYCLLAGLDSRSRPLRGDCPPRPN